MELPENFIDRTGYRLLTDAEWEYTCRGHTKTRYGFGDSIELLGSYAWFQDNSNGRAWPVASLKPNARGFFDMHGNVSETCHDIWDVVRQRGVITDSGHRRPLKEGWQNAARGGGYSAMADEVRSANRRGNSPVGVLNAVTGFRIARTIAAHDVRGISK